jgi:hypothetical protein
MTGTLLPIAQTLLDDNGNPVSGGLVYTYVAGTSTPLTTWSDSTLATPNANPIVCDSAGRFTMFTGTAAYKLIAKTAAGVTLWTRDGLIGSSLPALRWTTLSVNTTAASSVGVGPTTLMQYTLPANTITTNGWGVRVRAGGVFAANANLKLMLLSLNGIALVTTGGPRADLSNDFIFESLIIRMDNTHIATSSFWQSAALANTPFPTSFNNLAGFDFASNMVILISAQGVANADAVQNLMTVEILTVS